MRSNFIGMVLAAGMLAFSSKAGAQHATETDIADGERAYGTTCVVCHGPDGNLIEGIDLGRGQYRRDYTDAQLLGIIIEGVPDTTMPPNPGMSVEQAERIVDYLRAWAERDTGDALAGDRDRGRDLFFGQGDCTSCHAVNGRGARHGPDLSAIGTLRGAAELEASLVDPGARMQPTNRRIELELASGEEVAGRLLNHDTFTLQLIDEQDRLRSFEKAALRSWRFAESSMPDYSNEMSAQQIADLVSYLASLQGPR